MKKNLVRILIIEDNVDHAELLSQVIERHFAPVDLHTVDTIDDAIEFTTQTEYDIVFMDCYLGNENVVAQIPHLRNMLGETPIIIITGSGDESLAADVIKKGATDYLVKTKSSIEKIPIMINKYAKTGIKAGSERGSKEGPIREKIMDEVASLGRRAKSISSHGGGHTLADDKQLKSLLDQIQRLKNLATRLVNK